MREEYEKLYQKDLLKQVESDVSYNFKNLLIGLSIKTFFFSLSFLNSFLFFLQSKVALNIEENKSTKHAKGWELMNGF